MIYAEIAQYYSKISVFRSCPQYPDIITLEVGKGLYHCNPIYLKRFHQ